MKTNMRINAIATGQTFNMSAALASPEVRGIEHLLRQGRIELTDRLNVHELDDKLSKTNMTPVNRMALKGALRRAGILI